MTLEPAKHLGRSQRRLEDRRFVTGEGRFVSDFATPDTLHATFVRSVVPHGRIVSIDLGDAGGMPRVVAVMTADDLELNDITPLRGVSEVGAAMRRPPLARERVRYVGEPIAIVVAETRVAGLDAAEQVWPDLEELPPVVEPRTAAEGEPLFPVGNVAYHAVFPSVTQATEEFPVTAAVEVENQRLAPSPIEGLAILCEPEDGALKI
ncbi:MAG: xanthine dehydrogenase family protein molybdopterin-binding subunit, partial [Acidimicrobiia bacterium]